MQNSVPPSLCVVLFPLIEYFLTPAPLLHAMLSILWLLPILIHMYDNDYMHQQERILELMTAAEDGDLDLIEEYGEKGCDLGLFDEVLSDYSSIVACTYSLLANPQAVE